MSAALFNIAPAQWGLLRRLLDEAMDLPAAKRAGWLTALPPEHATLRARLEELLAHADDETGDGGIGARAGRRFGSMPRLAPIDDGPPPLPPDAGPYRAIRLLGEGGMGRVWLAERTDGLLQGRPVALKLPLAPWRHPQLAERMAHEREILAVLDHPHIARIHDAGVTAEGQPFLALEYIEGERIDHYVRRLGLDTRQRLALFLQVTSAVAHAHARLVVHRDLKPGNILVTAQGQVRLLDFGIAKLLAVDPANAEPTVPTQRALTPHYAAPEQIQGRPIGTAADIYSLGVVLYELLTGVLPYQPKRASPAALEDTILSSTPARPSQKAADASTRRLLQGDFDTVLLKALKKDPAERYATVQAFADDLQHWLDNRPVAARADGAWYHARKFMQRNRLGVGLAAGFVLSLGAALGFALWQATEARAQATKATAITEFLVSLFRANDIEQAEGYAKRDQSVQQLLEHSADALATGLSGQPELRAELLRVVGGLLHDLEIPEAAIRVRQQRVDDLPGIGASTEVQRAALRELSASQRAAHQEKAARDTLVAARRLCPEAAHDAPPDCLGVEVDLGRLDFIDSRWDAALGHLKPVLPELAAKAAGTEDQAAAYELLASLHASRNETDQALKHFEQAIAIRESMWGKNSARIAQTHLRFGRTLWTLRQLSQAEAELEKAWRISSTTLGPKHVLSARIEANLGRLQFYLGISPEGLPHLEHARQALHRQRSRIDPIEIFQVQVLWANALVLDGHLARARDELAEAMNLHSRLKTHAGPDVTLDVSQARWLIDTGQFAEGRQILERLRDSAIARSGPKHPDVADRRSRLAQAWLASGEPIRAEAELAAAMDTQDAAETQFGSPQHRAQLVLLALRLAQGRYDLAATLATSLEQGAQKTPRREQLREALVQMHSAVGRTWAGTGRHADADVHLVKAIELLDAANPDHPGLVELRAYRAQNLAATHGGARACEELARAQTLLAKLPMLGPQFRGAVLDAQSRIRCARAPLLAARSMSLDPNGPTANR